MKKILSVLLSILIISSSGVLCAFAENDDSTGFAVACDIHYVHPAETTETRVSARGKLSFNDSTGYGTAASGFVIDSFLKDCAENPDCDFILIPGDIATYSRDFEEDTLEIAAKFRDFEQKTGKQIYVINGNHDNGSNSVTDHNKFISVYNEFGYDEAISTDEGTCSYSVILNDEYLLIALDSCDETLSLHSDLNSSRMKWVRKQADFAKKTDRKPILMMHHNLLEHTPFQAISMDSYIVSTPRIIAEEFADIGIKLCFTGHSHVNDVKSFTSLAGKTIYDFSGPSLTEFPCEYKLFTVSDKEITYKTESIKGIDSDALNKVCSGFTDEQLEKMKTDYHSFIAECRKDSFARELDEILTAGYLGVKESGALYPFVDSMLSSVRAGLDTPLYGENSISSLASEYGLKITGSDYESLREMIYSLYAGTVSGSKIYKNSEQYKAVTETIAVVLRSSLAESVDGEILSGANEILKKAGLKNGLAETVFRNNCKLFGFSTPFEKAAFSIVYSLFGGYIAETDGVDNLSGTLPGYGVSENFFISLFRRIIDFISSIFTGI